MIIGFKKQFVEPIMTGDKIHTIREDKSNRWKAGMLIQMATGVRTKNYNQFNDGQCVSVQEIEIIHRPFKCLKITDVYIDGRTIDFYQLQKLAINDGFANVGDFLKWFNADFKGKIIHWTDFKY